MPESLKNKTVKGVAWTSLDQVATLGFAFVIGVILARLLSPSDYGLLAMIAIFNAIAFAFINSGFGNALIRKPDLTEDDNCTAFYFNILAGVVMTGVIWLIAPWVAIFYDKPILTQLLRVEGLLLIISSFTIVQNSQLSRALNFKAKMIINISSQVIAGAVAIFAAYHGFGVWSLVIQHFASSIIRLILLWIFSPWRPRGRWNNSSFRYLWGFGSKMLASGLLDTVYTNIYPIVIGKFYSAADLGQYKRARDFSSIPSAGLTGVIQQVTFPVMSQIQEDNNRLSSSYRRMLRFTVFLVFPIMIGMAVLAHPLVISLVTEKWAQCVPYLQVLCLAMMWYPVHAINLTLLQVKGRSDLFLRLEIIKKVIITIAIIISIPYGVMGICIGSVFSSIICLAINTYYTGKLIQVGFFRQMKDMTPTLVASFAMGAIVYFSTMPFDKDIIKLAIGIPLGILVYLEIAKVFRMPELQEAIDIIHRR
jgi:O-antigen/teichoic acid export membrane protein